MAADPNAIAIVSEFSRAWGRLDFSAIGEALSDHVIYHNIPMAPIIGKAAVCSYLRSAGPFDACEWEIRSIAANGSTVLTERVDRFSAKGVAITLPVMGVFEIENGLIAQWRDYFDLASYRAQWPSDSP